jgi:hypothetical protein
MEANPRAFVKVCWDGHDLICGAKIRQNQTKGVVACLDRDGEHVAARIRRRLEEAKAGLVAFLRTRDSMDLRADVSGTRGARPPSTFRGKDVHL